MRGGVLRVSVRRGRMPITLGGNVTTKRNRLIVLASSLALTAGMTLTMGSPSQAVANVDPNPGSGYSYDLDTFTTTDLAAAAELAKLDRILPKDWDARVDRAYRRLNIDPGPAEQAVEDLLNAQQGECGKTKLDKYINKVLKGIPRHKLVAAFKLAIPNYPAYDALLFGKPGPKYKIPGKASQLKKAFKIEKGFWDVKLNDIKMLGMHSSMVQDSNRRLRLYRTLYGLTPAKARQVNAYVANLLRTTPKLRANPLWSLNAFAFTGRGQKGFVGKLPDKMVFGDGLVKALKFAKLGKYGNRVVLAHEMGHHVQFELGVFDHEGKKTAEKTRRTELMADSFAGYFVTHDKGLNFGPRGRRDAAKVTYMVGDCEYDNPDHHGTPSQRERAEIWGSDRALQTPAAPLPAAQFLAEFDIALPVIIG